MFVASYIDRAVIYSVTALVQQLSETYNLPLKPAYNSTRGFHIQMYCGGKDPVTMDSLPSSFMKKTKLKNTYSFTTNDLVCKIITSNDFNTFT